MQQMLGIAKKLEQAVKLHRQGRLSAAQLLYEEVLRTDARHFVALHFLGLIMYTQRRYAEAYRLIGKALKSDPRSAAAHSNLGIVLQELGRYEEALASYDRALAIKPDFADAHNNRGLALRVLKRVEEALASYDRALAIRPDYAEALNNRGNVLLVLKRVEEALASYDRALAIRPDFAEALNGRGNVLLALKRVEEALASYDRALAIRPDYAEALNNRGNALLQLKRVEEALASYDRALAIRPDFAEALNSRVWALGALGRISDAGRQLERAIALHPKRPDLYRTLTRFKQLTSDDPQVRAMTALVREVDSFSTQDQIDLHYALGKVLADIGLYEESFDHLQTGAALKRQQITYDEASELARFEQIEAVFTPSFMRGKEGRGYASMVPVFIVGMPRSGSTLVEQVLASHPGVFGAGELNDFVRIMQQFPSSQDNTMAFPQSVTLMTDQDLYQLGSDYVAFLRTKSSDALKITDKQLANFSLAGLIHMALPNARIIHTVRDPADTCWSCFSTLFTRGQSYSYDFGELGRYYRAYQSLMEHWRNVLPEGIILDVQYEKVVADFEGQTRGILAHCGLEWDDACARFYATRRSVQTASLTQVRQPIYGTSVGRWRQYATQLRPLLETLKYLEGGKLDSEERCMPDQRALSASDGRQPGLT